jgi:TonB family protein
MSLLLDVLLRSSGILVATLIALPFLSRQSAALRHGVLAGAMVASAVALPLSWALPAWTVEVPTTVAQASGVFGAPSVASTTPVADAVEAARAPALATLMMFAWAVGVVVGAGVLALAFGRLRQIVLRATPVTDGPWSRGARQLSAVSGLRRPITLLQTDTPDVLATWGLIRPRILLPAHAHEWSEARIHAVLGHEMAHIQRHDWLVQVAAEGLRAIYWFNPLFWLACRRLRRESEQACDDAVLRLGVSPRDYAVHLLEVARSCRSSSLPVAAVMPMARPSTLERRIAAMLNPVLGRQALSRRAAFITATGLLALALPTAAFRLAQAGPSPLSGVIYDPSGGVLPEAALTLEDERQNKWQSTSDSTGRFEFPPVGSGKYVLEVALAGFRPLRQELTLAEARDWNRSVTLQVGTVRESITVREPRSKTPPRTAAGPVPVRVGGNIRPPTKTRDVKPVYPVSMREAGREGQVPLEAIIGRDGTVLSVRVATAQVHPDFAQAAIDAVQQWLFTPTMLNGKPVEVVMTVTIDFELED